MPSGARACPACTFANEDPAAAACEMCGTELPPGGGAAPRPSASSAAGGGVGGVSPSGGLVVGRLGPHKPKLHHSLISAPEPLPPVVDINTPRGLTAQFPLLFLAARALLTPRPSKAEPGLGQAAGPGSLASAEGDLCLGGPGFDGAITEVLYLDLIGRYDSLFFVCLMSPRSVQWLCLCSSEEISCFSLPPTHAQFRTFFGLCVPRSPHRGWASLLQVGLFREVLPPAAVAALAARGLFPLGPAPRVAAPAPEPFPSRRPLIEAIAKALLSGDPVTSVRAQPLRERKG